MAYVDISELRRVLQNPNPTSAQTLAMERVLDAAAQEIDWDLEFSADNPAPPGDPVLADVNLDRAVELWTANYSAYGMIPVGPDAPGLISPRDTWWRHHLRLQPLRTRFPIA